MKKWLVVCLGTIGLVITFHLGQTFNPTLAHQIPQKVNHVVLFNLKADTTDKDVEKIVTTGETLICQIPGVLEVNIGRKARDDRKVHFKNYDLAMYVKLSQLSDLDVYGPHEKHQEFIAQASPKLDLVQVIDFYGR